MPRATFTWINTRDGTRSATRPFTRNRRSRWPSNRQLDARLRYACGLMDDGGRRLTGQISIETGKEVEWASEENYHFRLSALCERLLAHYRAHPDFITPRVYMDGVVREVENGLADLSVSRPAKRLRWGIRVPADDSQTVYVWLDALVNYLSYAGYPWPPGQAGGGGLWPADVHVVGKDILRFHGIYWPAFLLALGQPLPRRILTHAHWTMNRAKMSKSAGNGASPGFALDRFGIDPLRFYLASDAALAEDSDYDNALVAERYRKSLQWGIGNLASRLLRGKRWNVRAAVERASTGGGGGGGGVEPASDAERAHLALLNRTPGVVAARMDELDPRRAVEAIMNVVFEVSRPLCLPSSVWEGLVLLTKADEQVLPGSRAVEADRRQRRRCSRPRSLHDRRVPADSGYPAAGVHSRARGRASRHAGCCCGAADDGGRAGRGGRELWGVAGAAGKGG